MDYIYHLQIIIIIHGLHSNPTHNSLQTVDYVNNLWIIPIMLPTMQNNPWIMPIIYRFYESDHNPHGHELLALHQVKSFKRKTNNVVWS